MTNPTKELRTDRSVLRRWRDGDIAPFAEMNADPRVMEFFPDTLTTEQTTQMIERIEQHFDTEGFGLWAVEIGGRFAGFTGLNRTSFDTPMGPHVEIGWRLATWAWGEGHATEAARAALHDGFTRVGVPRVFSFTTETNVRSEAVMVRIGMTRHREFDFDHPRTPGWWGQRHIVYSMSASQRDCRVRDSRHGD